MAQKRTGNKQQWPRNEQETNSNGLETNRKQIVMAQKRTGNNQKRPRNEQETNRNGLETNRKLEEMARKREGWHKVKIRLLGKKEIISFQQPLPFPGRS